MTHQRVGVVTGGGRGIGRGIVEALAELGMSVVINYRGNAKAAEEARLSAERRGAPKVLMVQSDVSDLAQSRQLLEKSLEEFGRIDLWVNNAGIAPDQRLDLLETSPESWNRVLQTNLAGPFFLTQLVAKEFIRLVENQVVTEPQIVFITSVSSTFASVNRGEYCVAKAGLSMLVKLFATRLAEHGIRVFEIRPGVIATDMTSGVQEVYDRRIAEGLSPIKRWGTPEDVGKAVAAIASGSFPFSTGEVIQVDGGLHIPRL